MRIRIVCEIPQAGVVNRSQLAKELTVTHTTGPLDDLAKTTCHIESIEWRLDEPDAQWGTDPWWGIRKGV